MFPKLKFKSLRDFIIFKNRIIYPNLYIAGPEVDDTYYRLWSHFSKGLRKLNYKNEKNNPERLSTSK